MASVYAVKHQVLGTRHALKVLHTTQPEIRDRLVREGRLQARLDPAHVVPVTDVVEVRGSPALLMPLVEGCSLEQLLEAHQPSETEVVALFSGVIAGVASAHAEGIIHRDLKPANVMLEVKRGVVLVRVADFGLAKPQEDDLSLTRTGIFMGTPAYAAPEQLLDTASVDHRSDLWSLGVMLFELLTGQRPFRAASVAGLITAVTHGEFDQDSVPERWRSVVVDLLRTDRDARTASAVVLLEAVSAIAEPCVLGIAGPVAGVIRIHVEAAQAAAHEAQAAAHEAQAAAHEAQARLGETMAGFGETMAGFGETMAGLEESMAGLEESMVPEPVLRHNLPHARDAFVGRQRDLATLSDRLGAGASLVSVLGMGGTGKTRLVLHYGWEHVADYPGGVWFCDLSEARSVDGICSGVARSLDVPLGIDDPVVQLGHAIAGRGRCLVVLDNFEQVTRHAEETLGKWLDRGSEAQFVVTTREVLGLAGEEALALAPLPTSEGAALFVARARSAKRDFEPEDVASIDALVKLLDGLPLAIELAAARVRLMPPAKLLKRMSQRFKLLTSSGGRRDRQATLRATLDWSWDLLSADEKAALAQLSVFEGGFTLDAAEEVLALDEVWPMDAVQALIDKSLVRIVTDDRFDLLVSVQEYAADRLDATGDRPDAEARHGAHFASYGTQAAVSALRQHGGVALRRALAPELDNALAACRRAVVRSDGTVAAGTAFAAYEVLCMSGPSATAVTVLEAARGAVDDELQRARLTEELADALRGAGRMAEAHAHCDAALALFRRLGNRQSEGNVLANLGVLHQVQGRIDEARIHYDAALDVAREVGARQLEGTVLIQLGNLKLGQGRIQEARAHYDAALVVAREVGDRGSEGIALGNQGLLYQTQGRMDEARAHYDDALALALEVGNRGHEGLMLGNLGNVHIQQGRMDEGRVHFDAALAVHREVGNRGNEGLMLGNLGTLHMMRGRTDEGRAHFDAALAVHREVGNRRYEGVVLDNLGTLHMDHGRMEEAQAHYNAALAVAHEVGHREGEGIVLGNLGKLYMKQGRLNEARVHYDDALAVLREVGNRGHEALVLGKLGEVHLQQGRLDEAGTCVKQSERLLREAESQLGLGELLCVRARIEHSQGNLDAARATLGEVDALAAAMASGPNSALGQALLKTRVAVGLV